MCLMEKLCDGRKTDCEFCLLKGGNCCGTSIDDIEYAFYQLDCLEPAIKSMKNKLLELRKELDKKWYLWYYNYSKWKRGNENDKRRKI